MQYTPFSLSTNTPYPHIPYSLRMHISTTCLHTSPMASPFSHFLVFPGKQIMHWIASDGLLPTVGVTCCVHHSPATSGMQIGRFSARRAALERCMAIRRDVQQFD